MPPELLLKHHADFMDTYAGEGLLTVEGGEQIACDFQCGQRKGGKLLLAVHIESRLLPNAVASGFTGRDTRTGLRLDVAGPFEYGGEGFAGGPDKTHTRLSFWPRRIDATSDATAEPGVVRFGITNFAFWSLGGAAQNLSLGDLHVSIEKVEGHDEAVARMKDLHNVEVTAEVTISCRPGLEDAAYEDIADDLCHLLSLARGTRVQWICSRKNSASGELLARSHYDRFTARYTWAPVFRGSDPDSGVATRRFIETAYPKLVAMKKSHGPVKGLLAAYIEARAESDFIDRRAVKLAVVVEMLKDVFLQLPDPPAKKLILKPKRFAALRDDLQKAIEVVLAHAGISDEDSVSICGKIGELNRPTFEAVLRAIMEGIGLVTSEKELRLFIRCRNAIVHTGRFYRPEPAERRFLFSHAGPEATGEALAEGVEYVAVFFFMRHFVDRMFLKLLGYSGPFRDARFRSPGILRHGPDALLE
jgi:hypothetical protein